MYCFNEKNEEIKVVSFRPMGMNATKNAYLKQIEFEFIDFVPNKSTFYYVTLEDWEYLRFDCVVNPKDVEIW